MKVCIYSYYFHPVIGGLQTFTRELAEYLISHEVAVTLITETNNQDTDDNFDFQVVRSATTKQLLSIIANSDVVHINGFALKIVLLSLLHRKRIIWTHHEYDSICPIGIGWNGNSSCAFNFFQCITCLRNKGMTKFIPKRFVSLIFRRITGNLVDCNINTTFYSTKRQNLPNNVVIPTPVHLSKYKSVDDDSNGRPFLFLGRLIEEKGVETLIQAVSRCVLQGYPVKVMICGNGPERERLRAISKILSLESNISFKDYKHGNDLVETINSSLALVVPSLWDEPFGLVALEAMSCGKVVIASDVGGLSELVRPVGLLFERGNAEALAVKMIWIYKNKNLRGQMEQKVRQYAQKFNWEILGKQYLHCFNLAVEGGNQGYVNMIS